MKYTQKQKDDAEKKLSTIDEELETNFNNIDTWKDIKYEALLCLKYQYKKILGLERE